MGLRRSLVVIDDHPLYRHGIIDLIRQELRMELEGEAGSFEEACDLLSRVKPDLVIVDISLQGKNGLDLVKKLKVEQPTTKVLVVSMHDEGLYGERALLAGARGYVMKHEPPPVLIGAVESVLQGRLAVSDSLRERMLEARIGGQQTSDPVESLSDRELEVFRRIGEGCGANEIAGLLHLSIKTVNAYREHIKKKLQLATASELRKYAVEWTVSRKGAQS